VKKIELLEELRRLTPDELADRKAAMEKEALTQRLQLGTAVMKNVRGLRELRRNIARLNTVIREKAGAGPGREG
jgi:large subunit ribosomal protein L29